MGIGRKRQVSTTDEIFDLIRDDLYCVERAIAAESITSVDTVRPIAKYLQRNSSPRLRAALLLLCTRLAGGGGSSRMAIQLGAAVEMMHSAALVHAEMIGLEQMRRGLPPANVKWANSTCVLAGDWLYLRAFRVAQQERLLHLVIGVAQKMATAELIQLDRTGSIGVTEADCIDLADRKTACLFSVCGRLGAVAAGVKALDEEKLADFGWNLGMAFQLIHDTLDFDTLDFPCESTSAKPGGSALKDGKVTLPLVYALENASPSERDLVARVLPARTYEAGSYDAVSFADILALVGRYDGIQRTRERAQQFADRAREIASAFPNSAYQRALFRLINLVSERDYE